MIAPEQFRQIMRQLAAGVTVITTELDGKPHGMTATAFTPLSLDPPLVLVCVNRSSDTAQALASGAYFGVNILDASQSALAARFAGKAPARYVWDDVEHRFAPHGAALLSGCAAALEARLSRILEGGDHRIYIGEIVWGTRTPNAEPLVYHQGRFHGLRPVVEPAPAVRKEAV